MLDVAREVQLRIKHWGYAYKLSNDTKWVDRAWLELTVSALSCPSALASWKQTADPYHRPLPEMSPRSTLESVVTTGTRVGLRVALPFVTAHHLCSQAISSISERYISLFLTCDRQMLTCIVQSSPPPLQSRMIGSTMPGLRLSGRPSCGRSSSSGSSMGTRPSQSPLEPVKISVGSFKFKFSSCPAPLIKANPQVDLGTALSIYRSLRQRH